MPRFNESWKLPGEQNRNLNRTPFQICMLNRTTIQNATVIGVPFILRINELPKGWSMGLPPLAVRHVALGKSLLIAGDFADVRIINSQLQAN